MSADPCPACHRPTLIYNKTKRRWECPICGYRDR